MDSQFRAVPFPALTLQLLAVSGSPLIQLCLLNTSATCLPFFLHVFCSFQIWTSASLHLLSFCFLKIMKVLSVATTYSSLVLLFLQSSSWLLYLKFKTVNPKRKSCSASNLFSPRAYRQHNTMDLSLDWLFYHATMWNHSWECLKNSFFTTNSVRTSVLTSGTS